MTKQVQYDLFISYTADDANWVEGFLIPALGIPSERIMTRESFRPGAETVAEFERVIVNSRYTVLVLSPAFLADMWASYSESIGSYARVKYQQDRLIPLLRKPCELPLCIAKLTTLDCTEKKNWQREIERLRERLDQTEPVLEALPCPYPGMRPFTEAESPFFSDVSRTFNVC